MARVKNLDQITGSLKHLSFYTRKGSDSIFVRTKGGASKEKIKRDPAFEGLRRNNMEFGGCSAMSKQIRMAFRGLEHVADFNLAPALSSLMKNIQKTDETHPTGQREIKLSAYRYLLAGFDFGRNNRFNSLLRVPLNYTINRETLNASIQIPAFACSFGLNTAQTPLSNYGTFRITASLGIVTDMHLNASGTAYQPVHDKLGQGFQIQSTPWYSLQGTIPEQTIELTVKNRDMAEQNFNETDTLVLTLIVETGAPDAFGNIMPVRGIGGGIVLGVG